jgi:hypothetical protein
VGSPAGAWSDCAQLVWLINIKIGRKAEAMSKFRAPTRNFTL